MNVRKDKIEVKVKEEEVLVAEITEEELITVIAKVNAELVSEIAVMLAIEDDIANIPAVVKFTNKLTDYASMLAALTVEKIFKDESNKEEKE